MRIGRRVAVGVLVWGALESATGSAAADVPPMQQSLLAFRVLAYDRNLKNRAGEVATIAILFKRGHAESEDMRDKVATAMVEAAKTTDISGLAVKIVRITYKDADELERVAGSQRLAAAYVCPGLLGDIHDISRVSRKLSILTVTPTEKYVDAGLGIGIVKRGARPTVLVNLPATRAEGTDLDAALLSLAEVKR
jgi:hypothetical protein